MFFGWATLAAGFFVLFLTGGTRHAIGLVLKPMADAFDWERGTLGASVAVFLVISAICMFVAGSLADRFPLRNILSGGLAICALGIGLMGFVTEPWQVILLYGLVFGIGAGTASPIPVGVMVTRRYPGRAGLANATSVSGMGLGQLVIIAALSAVLVGFGWQSVFIWLGIVNLAMVPFIFWAVRDDPSPNLTTSRDPSASTALRAVIRAPYFWLLVTVYAICGFQDFFISTHIVAFALDQGISTLVSGNLLALMGLAGLVGVIAAGAWSDRTGPVAPTLFCFALRVVIFAVIMVTKDPSIVMVFALLYGITFWITAPLTVIFVREAFGTRYLGALSGFITMVHHICGGFGAWLGAVHFDLDGNYETSFAIMAGSSVVGMILTFRLARRDRSNPGESEKQ